MSNAWHKTEVKELLDADTNTTTITAEDFVTELRTAEFEAWTNSPRVQRFNNSLLILSWAAVCAFAAIPATFAAVYATTFTDEIAAKWYTRMIFALLN